MIGKMWIYSDKITITNIFQMGEVLHNSMNSDLSSLGRDLYKWQRVQIKVANKQATIYLDDQPVHTITFKNEFGKVMGLVYHFVGTGAIDYVRVKNEENKLVYEDQFDN